MTTAANLDFDLLSKRKKRKMQSQRSTVVKLDPVAQQVKLVICLDTSFKSSDS